MAIGGGEGPNRAQSVVAQRPVVADEPCRVVSGTEHSLNEVVIGGRLVRETPPVAANGDDTGFGAVEKQMGKGTLTSS